MNIDLNKVERVIGLDAHPDTFTAALLRGQTPAQAEVLKQYDKVPIGQLKAWALKATTAQDLLLLEASGNSFQIVRLLQSIQRQALVLESFQLGKLKDVHASNDKISAIRIAKAFLSGTAKVVWVPDIKTQERRDWLHAHSKAVKRTTQMRCRLLSYLSDNGVRLPQGTEITPQLLREQRDWSLRQWQVLEIFLAELNHAQTQTEHWRSLMAQEVISDPHLLSLVRLCGVRDTIAFAVGAVIGDINRFANPKKLVKYIGLNPAFDTSGQQHWQGGLTGHGRKDLRCLLIEAAQSILRSKHELAKWGKQLLARKGALNLVVAAIARKLAIAIWYLMKGQWTALEEIDTRLHIKIGKIISNVGAANLKSLGKTRKDLRNQMEASLKTYQLNPNLQFPSQAQLTSAASGG